MIITAFVVAALLYFIGVFILVIVGPTVIILGLIFTFSEKFIQLERVQRFRHFCIESSNDCVGEALFVGFLMVLFIGLVVVGIGVSKIVYRLMIF